MLKNIVGIKCSGGAIIKVMKSNAGFYLGTTDEFGCPNCRITGYNNSEEGLLESSFEERDCPENSYCNNGCGCFR